jgi:protein phosphatase PTC7
MRILPGFFLFLRQVEKGGEDAYFISDYGGGVLGVADGVSGWAAEDVDPALYSCELMAHASNAAASEEVSFHLTILVASVLVDE